MHFVPLGNTGVTVSAVCLGTDYYGSRTPAALANQLLDQFADAGGTFLDTANTYAYWIPGFAGGESERVIGDWMEARRNRRQMFVATKVGFPYPGSSGGLRASEIEQECEKSLRRLKVDAIDLYYAHCDDRATPLEELLEAFHRLVHGGKVRFIGASNWPTWRLAEARLLSELRGWTTHTALEFRHTYLRPKPGADFAPQVVVTPELQDYCRSHAPTLLAYSILLSGAYTRPDRAVMAQYQSPDSAERLVTLHDIARETKATANQVIIAWLLRCDPPILPIIGGSTSGQLKQNLDALSLHLTAEQMNRLHGAGA
jgi:aryl-alcohol dehydrogenase-like predicted oxidoreductase